MQIGSFFTDTGEWREARRVRMTKFGLDHGGGTLLSLAGRIGLVTVAGWTWSREEAVTFCQHVLLRASTRQYCAIILPWPVRILPVNLPPGRCEHVRFLWSWTKQPSPLLLPLLLPHFPQLGTHEVQTLCLINSKLKKDWFGAFSLTNYNGGICTVFGGILQHRAKIKYKLIILSTRVFFFY